MTISRSITELNMKKIGTNIPIATAQLGTSIKIPIPNDLSFKQIMIVYNAPALTGGAAGSYIPNSIIASLIVNQGAAPSIMLFGSIDVGIAPYWTQLVREINKLKNGSEDTAEYYMIKFPTLQSRGKNSSIDLIINSLINIQTVTTGDRTTLTGGTLNVWILGTKALPKRETKILRSTGRIVIGALEGPLRHWINPTQPGYLAQSLILHIDDNRTPSNSAIAELELWKGTDQLLKGGIPELQEGQKNLAKGGQSHATGFIKIDIKRPIKAFELELITNVTSAGTAIDINYMLTSTKRVR